MQKGLLRPSNGLVVLWQRLLTGLLSLPIILPFAIVGFFIPDDLARWISWVPSATMILTAFVLTNYWHLIQPRIQPRVEWFFAGLLQPVIELETFGGTQ
jgi:hypothetical protein